LPRALQPKAKAALHEIWMAETRSDAQRAFDRFTAISGAKYPKAVECLAKDRAALRLHPFWSRSQLLNGPKITGPVMLIQGIA